MRQSLSKYSPDSNGIDKDTDPVSTTKEMHLQRLAPTKLRAPRPEVTAMGVGLLLTLVMLVALIVDQTSVNSIADHVAALYGPLKLHPDPNLLFGILYVTSVIGILLWVTMIWGVRRQKAWARVAVIVVFLVATSFALLVLFVSEFGSRIFPAHVGILGLLPVIAGLVTVTLLRPGRGTPRAAD